MIKIIDSKISKAELNGFLGKPFEKMVKFVVDVRKGTMALGGELHADGESLLLEKGSSQEDLWGANFFPQNPPEKQIQYNSMINIRPAMGFYSADIEDEKLKTQIKSVVEKLLL
jgi:hypothetical protein